QLSASPFAPLLSALVRVLVSAFVVLFVSALPPLLLPLNPRFSSSGISTPCRLMITACWITDSVLFQAQYITSPAGKLASRKVKNTAVQTNTLTCTGSGAA